jgi:hypothetical protein
MHHLCVTQKGNDLSYLFTYPSHANRRRRRRHESALWPPQPRALSDKKRINKSASSRERVSNASDLLIYLFICQQAVAVAAAAAEERGGRDLSKAVRSLPTCTFAIGALSLSRRQT